MFNSGSIIEKLHLLSRLLLGVVFVASGALKIISPQQASDLFSQMTSLDDSMSRALILLGSAIELLLGVMLIAAKKFLRLGALVSSIALLAFTFVGLWTLQDPRSCGCFGDVVDMKTDEYFVLRNMILLLISIFILRYSKEAFSKRAGETL